MAELVFNIEAASPSMIAALDRHCRIRTPDGTSAIDPARSHQNSIFYGSDEGLMQSLKDFYEDGVERPAKQAERPYLRCVASASPEYFRPNAPDAKGTWEEERLEPWIDAIMDHIEVQFGDDLVFAELHLDEDTPHIHFVVAPTYQKTARKPGRRKRNETQEEFEARKQAVAAKPTVRKVGRASNTKLSRFNSYRLLREEMALAVNHLGIEYGEDRAPDDPKAKKTRQWINEKAAEQKRKDKELQQREEELDERDRAIAHKEAIGFEAGRNAGLLAANEALDIADVIINAEVPKEELTTEGKTARKLVNSIRQAREQCNRQRQNAGRASIDPTAGWLIAGEQYATRVGEQKWRDGFVRIRDAHNRNISLIQSLPKTVSLVQRARALIGAIASYWNEVGSEISKLFKAFKPRSEDEASGALGLLLPNPLDESAVMYELARNVQEERRKIEFAQLAVSTYPDAIAMDSQHQ